MPDPIVNQGGAPTHMGPVGFWLDKDGNVAATDMQGNPQQTPGQRDNPGSVIYYDANKDLNYTLVNGKKLYQSPMSVKPGSKGSGHGMANKSASLLKSGGTWNPEKGEFDQGANWGNILSMVAAGVMTMGAATAIMGSAAPPLASTTIGSGLGTLPAGAATGAAGTAVGGATGAGAAGAGAGTLASTTLGTGATTLTAGAVPTGMGGAAATGIGSTIANTLKNPSTQQRIADLFGAGASGVGNATSTAHDNRLEQELLAEKAAEANARNLLGTEGLNLDSTLGTNRLNLEGLIESNNSNISGQSSFESELMNRAKEEASQRSQASKDVYRASDMDNPRVSPFDPAGAPKYSDQYRGTMHGLADQGATKLSKPGQYDTNNMPALQPYTPITAPTFTAPTFATPKPIDVQTLPGSQPGTGEKVGNWLGPGLSVAEQIAKWWAMRGNQ